MNRKLTIDYGVRYDLQKPEREIWHRQSAFRAGLPNVKANNFPGGIVYEGSGPGRCNCYQNLSQSKLPHLFLTIRPCSFAIKTNCIK